MAKFKKGHIPWNKNLKGIHLSPKSQFKKGITVLENHPNWKGGVYQFNTGETYVSVGVNKRVRRSRLVWEQNYGKIPEGYVIYHKDKDNTNDDINNLELISRAELVKRNNPKNKKGGAKYE